MKVSHNKLLQKPSLSLSLSLSNTTTTTTNMDTTHSSNNHQIPTNSLEPNKTFKSDHEDQTLTLYGSCLAHMDLKTNVVEPETYPQVSGREKLKRHRTEVAGRVLIPDKWDQEKLLKEWMDYSSFDRLLAPNGVGSAREALVAEGRRAKSRGILRIESRC